MEPFLVYGADWCSDCHRTKAFLEKHAIPFAYVDITANAEAVATVERSNGGKRVIPTIDLYGRVFSNPSLAELSGLLGINDNARVVLFGAEWCPDCRRAKAYLDDHHVHYMFVDVDRNPWAAAEVEAINKGRRVIPTILVDGTPMINPDNAALRDRLGLADEVAAHVYDSIVIGAGPAGLTTAMYNQREKISTLVLERSNVGGNAALTERIENYPGFDRISGPELMNKMAAQATTYGAVIREGTEVQAIERTNDLFKVRTNMGDFEGKTVVLSVGSTYSLLGIPGEEELIGAGIHFCATCDGPFYRDRDLLVVGGGNSALEEGLFLSEFARSVTFVVRRPEFSASQVYIDKISSRPNVTTVMNVTSRAVASQGPGTRLALSVTDNVTGTSRTLDADGMFVFVGMTPNTGFVQNLVDIDARGFVTTVSGTVETSVPGIFVAGDSRKGAIAQIASATGEGVLASFGVKHHVRSRW